jgi:hypothetical protein
MPFTPHGSTCSCQASYPGPGSLQSCCRHRTLLRGTAIPFSGMQAHMRLERDEKNPEEIREERLLLGRQRINEASLIGQMSLEGLIDEFATLAGETNEEAAAVIRVGQALDQLTLAQLLQPIGHCPGREQERPAEDCRREAVRKARAAECRQHIELTDSESIAAEQGADILLEIPRHAEDAADGGHRREIEVRPLPRPLFHDLVDMVVPHGQTLAASPLRHPQVV